MRKPFDINSAKRGEPIVTRSGKPGKFIAHVFDAKSAMNVLVLIDGEIHRFSEDGSSSLLPFLPSGMDLFMDDKPRLKEGWVNCRPELNNIYPDWFAAALECKEGFTTCRITWEEDSKR